MAIKINKKINNKSGFVILFAVLLSTTILLVSAGVFSLAFKSTILSSYAEESNIAFYAADSGIECALYWDISPDIANTAFDPLSTTTGSVRCADTAITVNNSGDRYWFSFDLNSPGDDKERGCAFVLVDKITQGGFIWSEITSAGYNSCETTGGVVNPDGDDLDLVERRISIRYPTVAI